MRRNVIGHFSETLMAVCSTPSSPLRVVLPADAATLLKFLLTRNKEQHVLVYNVSNGVVNIHINNSKRQVVLLVMQCSAGRSRFFRSPWRTDRTDGLWTSCSTNRWDCTTTSQEQTELVQTAEAQLENVQHIKLSRILPSDPSVEENLLHLWYNLCYVCCPVYA